MPWPKGKACSEETKRKLSKALMGNQNSLGYKHTPETIEKMRKYQQTHDNVGRFRKGHKTNLGKRHIIPHGYKKGHKTNLGRRHSEESKKKMSKAATGKHPSEETRRKMSVAHKGQIPWNTGKPRSQETRQKIRESRIGKTLSKETRQKLREARLRQKPPTRNTSIERFLHEELDQRNISYQTHLPICGVCQPDIVFQEEKIVIFADGDYWHSKEFKNGTAWEKDRRQDKILRENGWKVFRFWGHEIRENVGACVDRVFYGEAAFRDEEK